MSRTEPQSVLMYRHQGDEQHTKKVEKQKPVRQEGNHTQSERRTRKHIRRGGGNYGAHCDGAQGMRTEARPSERRWVIFNGNGNRPGMKLKEWAAKHRESATSFEKSPDAEKQGTGVVRWSEPAQVRCLRYKACHVAGLVTLHGPRWLQRKLPARQAGSQGLHGPVSDGDARSTAAPPAALFPVLLSLPKRPRNTRTVRAAILPSLHSLSSLRAATRGVVFARNVVSLVPLQ